MADKFRTGNSALDSAVLISLTIPSALWFRAELSDLLGDMTREENWTQEGTVTIENAVQAAQDMYWSLSTMVGQIHAYITATTPDNMLPCDGSVYNRVDYPSLYSVLDTAFIISADTFKTPDLRGRTIIGAGTGTGLTARSVGASGGEETHVLIVGELAAHHHAYDPIVIQDVDLEDLGLPQGNAAQILPGTENTYDEGANEAHNNMQPFTVLRYGVIAW
jgi:microcystin-dependent protein